jgi:RNA-directed DNA polymerase
MPVIKHRLEDLFKAMYHDKFDCADFLKCPVHANCKEDRFEHKGSIRDVLEPNKKLKAYLRFLNIFLFEHLPLNTGVVFSYRKGVGPYDAVAPHAKSRHFFQTDITSFFSNVDRQMILEAIIEGRDSCPISNLDEHLDRILDLVCVDDELPTGFPTSPPISNAVLKKFDDTLEEHCHKMDLVFTRYSDDIILSAKDNETIYEAFGFVSELLQEATSGKLVLNKAKSRHVKIGRRVEVLGMVIRHDGQITVSAKTKNEIEVLLHFYLKNRESFLKKVENNIDSGMKRVAGYLNYINTFDAQYLDSLRRKYGAATVDRFLHREFE